MPPGNREQGPGPPPEAQNNGLATGSELMHGAPLATFRCDPRDDTNAHHDIDSSVHEQELSARVLGQLGWNCDAGGGGRCRDEGGSVSACGGGAYLRC